MEPQYWRPLVASVDCVVGCPVTVLIKPFNDLGRLKSRT